ncbi:MAG TPA: EAL domain-containing protein, partial [Pseudoxanthomonas sp.]|nr:EAL domain-containing protein [Pseudoxanthomonas sp.]
MNQSSVPAPPHLPRLGAGEPELGSMVATALSGGPGLMLLYLDIDHFRSINENMGMEVGDQALALVSERLRRVAGPDARVWSHGSDEFVVAVPRGQGPLSPQDYGHYLRDQIELPMTVLPYTLVLTATIGIALCPEQADSATALLQCAESAVDQAKYEGLNLVRVYQQGAAISRRSESIIAQQMVDAIANGELRLLYQPQVNAHDGRVMGMEVLLRWHSAELGVLAPQRFLHVAEKLGLIVQIGHWVLKETFQQARAWRDRGVDDFEIAVNIST